MIFLCSENGFQEGLSTIGMVSGLFGAVWSFGWVWVFFTDILKQFLRTFLFWFLNVVVYILKCAFVVFFKDVLWPNSRWSSHTAPELPVGSCRPRRPGVYRSKCQFVFTWRLMWGNIWAMQTRYNLNTDCFSKIPVCSLSPYHQELEPDWYNRY